MNGVNCPKCGAVNAPGAAFCGTCGTSLPAQPLVPPTPPVPPAPGPSAGWQQSAGTQPPPAGAYPPPPGAYPPPPAGYIPMIPATKIVGDNTKWAIGLGIAGFFCCGPFTAIPGIFMAKKDMDDIAAGRAPQLNDGWAKAAFYLNIVDIGLFILGICLFWGRLAAFRHL